MMKFLKKISILHILITHTVITVISFPVLFSLEWLLVSAGTTVQTADIRSVLGFLLVYGGVILTYIYIISMIVPWILYGFKLKKTALYTALSPWVLLLILIIISFLLVILNALFA